MSYRGMSASSARVGVQTKELSMGILHWLAHLLRLNMSEGDMRKVDGHTYYGVKCITCDRWKRGIHSPLCPCGWTDEHWPSPQKRQR